MSEWKTGNPKEIGYYDCLVNGKEQRLYHWICSMNPDRHEWIDENDRYVKDEVLWRGTASVMPW